LIGARRAKNNTSKFGGCVALKSAKNKLLSAFTERISHKIAKFHRNNNQILIIVIGGRVIRGLIKKSNIKTKKRRN